MSSESSMPERNEARSE